MRTTLLCSALTVLLPLTTVSAQSRVQPAASVQNSAMLLDQLLDTAVADAAINANSAHVVPLWSTPDGRVLAAVALANPTLSPLEPAAPQVGNALDWRLIDATALFANRLDIRLGNQLLANARFRQTPILLSDRAPLTPNACLQLGNGMAPDRYVCPGLQQNIKLDQLYSGDIGADWTAGQLSLDVNLGLTWLAPSLATDTTLPTLRSNALPAVPIAIQGTLPTLVLPVNDLYRLDSGTTLGARGRWTFPSGPSLDLGANFGRIRLIPDASGFRSIYNQTALSLGIDSPTLSGNITGRIFNPLTANALGQQRWAGIDLGVTWHTPWQAELSIGAQNLWASPPLTGNDADNQARTPYVQYHQDL